MAFYKLKILSISSIFCLFSTLCSEVWCTYNVTKNDEEFSIPLSYRNFSEEKQQKILDMSCKILDEVNFGNTSYKKEVIEAAFAWTNILNPRLIREFEPKINELVKDGLINIENLWLKGLKTTEYIDDINGQCTITDAPLFFRRMISAFKGDTLLIGEKHSKLFSSEKYYTLDAKSSEEPDVVGNAIYYQALMPFPDNKFDMIIFNYIAHTILLKIEPLIQYFRMLKPSGKFDFKSQHFPASYIGYFLKQKVHIYKNLTDRGFQVKLFEIEKDPNPGIYEDYFLHVKAKK